MKGYDKSTLDTGPGSSVVSFRNTSNSLNIVNVNKCLQLLGLAVQNASPNLLWNDWFGNSKQSSSAPFEGSSRLVYSSVSFC